MPLQWSGLETHMNHGKQHHNNNNNNNNKKHINVLSHVILVGWFWNFSYPGAIESKKMREHGF